MSTRTTFLHISAVRIALALAVAGVALVACGEAPTPTATLMSTPTATDLRAVAEQACEAMKTMDYDIASTVVSTRQEGVLTVDARISSGDSHAVLTSITPSGIAHGETVRIDGVMYSRESIQDNPTILGEWAIVGENMSGADSLPCFSPETVARAIALGASSKEPHHSSNYGAVGDSVLNEFWLDSSGRLARWRRTVTLSNENSASEASQNKPLEQIITNQTYSGYGEPNTITAPALPTPTPTPTAAP